MNPHRYQHEEIGNAMLILMSLDISPEERIAGAMLGLRRAFDHATPSGEAFESYNKILEIMGIGPTRERIPALTGVERNALIEAFLMLERRVSLDYHQWKEPPTAGGSS